MAKRRSYSWARRIPADAVARLSDDAREGLAWAQELADNAAERSGQIDDTANLPPRLTVKDLAEGRGVSPAMVQARIRRAIVELFGRYLSDSAIDYRLRTGRTQAGGRPCREPGCDRELPREAPPNRLYCDEHQAPAARTRRSRGRLSGRCSAGDVASSGPAPRLERSTSSTTKAL